MPDTTETEPPAPVDAGFLHDVLTGLGADRKNLPPKYFYDSAGSALFGQICELPEYYPTRTEIGILKANAVDIAAAVGPDALIIEYGAGSQEKIRVLLDAADRPAGFVPVDISRSHLLAAADDLRRAYPGLAVQPVAADFTRPLTLPEPVPSAARRVAFFPGSTIGNFEPEPAVDFMTGIARTVGPGGGLLIGADLQKDTPTLVAAYDDAAGVTAAFNLNLLVRINRELGGDFDPARFRHLARYDTDHHRIEMHLVSDGAQTVHVAGEQFTFADGETIHTENSYKYTVAGIDGMAARAGFHRAGLWTDPDRLFAVVLYRTA